MGIQNLSDGESNGTSHGNGFSIGVTIGTILTYQYGVESHLRYSIVQ